MDSKVTQNVADPTTGNPHNERSDLAEYTRWEMIIAARALLRGDLMPLTPMESLVLQAVINVFDNSTSWVNRDSQDERPF